MTVSCVQCTRGWTSNRCRFSSRVLRCSFVYSWFCRTFWLSAWRIVADSESDSDSEYIYANVYKVHYLNSAEEPRMSHWKRSITSDRDCALDVTRVIEHNLFYLLTILRFRLISSPKSRKPSQLVDRATHSGHHWPRLIQWFVFLHDWVSPGRALIRAEKYGFANKKRIIGV